MADDKPKDTAQTVIEALSDNLDSMRKKGGAIRGLQEALVTINKLEQEDLDATKPKEGEKDKRVGSNIKIDAILAKIDTFKKAYTDSANEAKKPTLLADLKTDLKKDILDLEKYMLTAAKTGLDKKPTAERKKLLEDNLGEANKSLETFLSAVSEMKDPLAKIEGKNQKALDAAESLTAITLSDANKKKTEPLVKALKAYGESATKENKEILVKEAESFSKFYKDQTVIAKSPIIDFTKELNKTLKELETGVDTIKPKAVVPPKKDKNQASVDSPMDLALEQFRAGAGQENDASVALQTTPKGAPELIRGGGPLLKS